MKAVILIDEEKRNSKGIRKGSSIKTTATYVSGLSCNLFYCFLSKILYTLKVYETSCCCRSELCRCDCSA